MVSNICSHRHIKIDLHDTKVLSSGVQLLLHRDTTPLCLSGNFFSASLESTATRVVVSILVVTSLGLSVAIDPVASGGMDEATWSSSTLVDDFFRSILREVRR